MRKEPKVFGKRAILMMRFNGSIRIIYPDGIVEWVTNEYNGSNQSWEDTACTTCTTQLAAYKEACAFDCLMAGLQQIGESRESLSAFLGYL